MQDGGQDLCQVSFQSRFGKKNLIYSSHLKFHQQIAAFPFPRVFKTRSTNFNTCRFHVLFCLCRCLGWTVIIIVQHCRRVLFVQQRRQNGLARIHTLKHIHKLGQSTVKPALILKKNIVSRRLFPHSGPREQFLTSTMKRSSIGCNI